MSMRYPSSMRPRYTWRRPGDIVTTLVIALVLSVWVYLWDGQAFVLWGSQTAAYYIGLTTEATVIDADASDFVGIPSDDSVPEQGARGEFTDDSGNRHTIFLQHASTYGQRASVSYLPFLPGLAVERADYESNPAIYLIFTTLSGVILFLYWHFVLRHLLVLREKVTAKDPASDNATIVESD
jgi:hypothetical protein